MAEEQKHDKIIIIPSKKIQINDFEHELLEDFKKK